VRNAHSVPTYVGASREGIQARYVPLFLPFRLGPPGQGRISGHFERNEITIICETVHYSLPPIR